MYARYLCSRTLPSARDDRESCIRSTIVLASTVIHGSFVRAHTVWPSATIVIMYTYDLINTFCFFVCIQDTSSSRALGQTRVKFSCIMHTTCLSPRSYILLLSFYVNIICRYHTQKYKRYRDGRSRTLPPGS